MHYLYINIRSEFSIKIRARPLVKIDLVIFIYVTTPHSESAVLVITHENRALLQMASRFAQVGEEEIPQIISDSIPTKQPGVFPFLKVKVKQNV